MASLPPSTVRRERFTAPDPSQMPSVHLALTSALAFIPVNARSEAKTSQGWLFTSRPGSRSSPCRAGRISCVGHSQGPRRGFGD